MCEAAGTSPRALFFERGGVRYRSLRWGLRSGGTEPPNTLPPATPVVLLHGFSQSAHTWDEVAPQLATGGAGRSVWAPEFVGHGGSDRPEDAAPYAFDELVATLAAFVDEVVLRASACEAPREGRVPTPTPGPGDPVAPVEGGKVVLVGYSMGGRVALAYARAHPERLAALVLESAGLGPADEQARHGIAARNAALAARLRTEGLTAFMDFWETRPVFASQLGLPRELRAQLRSARMANDPEALARTFEGSGAHVMPDLSGIPAHLPCPVLYLAGELDATYAAIARELLGPARGEAPTERRVGGMDADGAPGRGGLAVRVLPGVGHSVHLEDPTTFCREVMGHLGATLDAPLW